MGRGIEGEGIGSSVGAIYAQAVDKRLVGVVPKGVLAVVWVNTEPTYKR